MEGLKCVGVTEKSGMLGCCAISAFGCVPTWSTLAASDALCTEKLKGRKSGFPASQARTLSFFSLKSGGELGLALTFVNET